MAQRMEQVLYHRHGVRISLKCLIEDTFIIITNSNRAILFKGDNDGALPIRMIHWHKYPLGDKLVQFLIYLCQSASGTLRGFRWMGATWGSKLKEMGSPVYLPSWLSNTSANSRVSSVETLELVAWIPDMPRFRAVNQSNPSRLGRLSLMTISGS